MIREINLHLRIMAAPEIKYMQRALELARLGIGRVSPNPMVGCVIVHKGQIIGEGFHQQWGGPHAEVNAIQRVADHRLLSASEVYVTLEPCAHFGKTPPCANLLADQHVKSVYIANMDPNPLVAGKGIEILKKEGIEVQTGLMAAEGETLNKRFFTAMRQQRPYVILKWAQTADGFIARKNFDSKWISNVYSRKLVHKWRAEEDAILVGKNTALHDNPSLNVRDWVGNDPVRIVLDFNLSLDSSLHLFDGSQPTVCFNLKEQKTEKNLQFIKVTKEDFLSEIMHKIHEMGLRSVIVEGGAHTLQTFIDSSCWDEARVFESDTCFGEGILAPQLTGALLTDRENIMGDTLKYFKKA